MTSTRRLPAFLAGLTLLACAVAALALPAGALASKCGDQVLEDWADNGRIDGVYALQCYQDAIADIPADIRDYANAEEIISRALSAAALDDENGSGGTGGGTGGSGGNGGGGGSEQPGREPSGPVDSPSGSGGSEATPTVSTSDPSSVPIPLLLLAVMSLALLGAGGLGYLSRRRNVTADGLIDDPRDD
jgi:cobalamin biosynthesis Mg chelatase CobN